MEYFVISKGRSDVVGTSRLLDASGIAHTIVVEPQDKEAYEKTLVGSARLMVLPENDRGIVYVRNFVLNNARRCGIRYLCMMDDDVKAVGAVKDRRCVKGDAKLLELASQIFARLGFAQMGLQYQQFAWSATKDFTSPTHCDCVSFLDMSRLNGVGYDPYVAMKEDWDFSLQVLKMGGMTAVLNRIWMSVPTMGANKGGLSDDYASHKDWIAAERLARKWGTDIVTTRWRVRGGKKTLDCKVDWKHFTHRKGA